MAIEQGIPTESCTPIVFAQPFASIAGIEMLNTPPDAGVPERTPALEKLMPGGSAPAVHVTGATPPLCEKLRAAYATLGVAPGSVDGEIAIAGQAGSTGRW